MNKLKESQSEEKKNLMNSLEKLNRKAYLLENLSHHLLQKFTNSNPESQPDDKIMDIFYKSSEGMKKINLYNMEENKYRIGLTNKATILVTRDALNFPNNISNNEAKVLLQKGLTLTHKYFLDTEFIKMKLGIIYDENNYELGYFNEFIKERKIFDKGWSVYYS